MQPSVIFIDEVDSVLSRRDEKENESSKKMKTEFLVQMDGAATSKDDSVMVLAATNRPMDLDEAVRRRFVKRFYIPLPDNEGRLQILKSIFSKEVTKLTETEFANVANQAKGYSGADLHKVCREAAMMPIRECSDIMDVDVNQIRATSEADLILALATVKPSVAAKEVKHYEEFDKMFGDKP